MGEHTITVRDEDEPTLSDMAATQWRNPDQQASALLEQAFRAQRAKADPTAPRRPRARKVTTGA